MLFGFVNGRSFYGAGGRVGGVNSIRPFSHPHTTRSTWGASKPPLPKPFAPSWELAKARLGGLRQIVALGLSQIWGLWNGARQRKVVPSWSALDKEVAEFSTPGTVVINATAVSNWDAKNCGPGWMAEASRHDSVALGPTSVANCSGIRWQSNSFNGWACGAYNSGDPVGPMVAEARVAGAWKRVIEWASNSGIYKDGTRYVRIEGSVVAAFGQITLNGSPVTSPTVYGDLGERPPIKIPSIAPTPVIAPGVPEVAPPQTVPDADPLPQPDRPGAIPAVPPTIPGIAAPPKVEIPTLPKPAVKPGVATTPSGSVIPWPGAKPVGLPGQAPQPTLEGIAQEVGKIEQKLEQAFTNPKPDDSNMSWADWWESLDGLRNLILGLLDAGQYEISSPCVKDGEPGSVSDPLIRAWGPSLGPAGGLENRLNALAGLLQDHKNLKQPNCEAQPSAPPAGTSYTVRFLSTLPSPASGDRLRKDFGYRDQSGRPLEEHTRHWVGFEWNSGPWICFSTGLPWGKPRVWAASPQEGERVLRHAAAIAGVDLDSDAHQFVFREAMGERTRYVLRMHLRRDDSGRPWVSTRDATGGPPELIDHLPASLKSRIDSGSQ
jgi:hypothetical protein